MKGKRIFYIFLAFVILCSLSGCSEKEFEIAHSDKDKGDGISIGPILNSGHSDEIESPSEIPEVEDDTRSEFDIPITKDGSITIDSFYSDYEEKVYAKNVIGTKMPYFEFDKNGMNLSNNDLGDQYIIEFFGTSCPYSQASIPAVDNFRENHSIPVIGLTISNGDLSAFNENGEHSFYFSDWSQEFDSFFQNFPWVPSFVYVEDGVIKLVTNGGVYNDDLERFAYMAFDETW